MSKSSRPMVRIHNTETNEIIDREMNDEEFAIYIAAQEERTAKLAEEAAKAEAKDELLKRLGITAEEAELLLA
jgi:hypothetical protein